MLNNKHFYNKSIRNTVVLFGTLFNDIELVRFDTNDNPKERVKVPLVYGPKEKYITRIDSDPTLNKSILTLLPRISFNLDNIQYDSSRKQITTTRNFSISGNTVYAQYIPVPYNFSFTLSVYTRNTEDGTQILEQILPFFTPDFTVTADFIEDIGLKYDIPVILTGVNDTTTYEGNFDDIRHIIWDLTFTVKSYIFPPVKNLGDMLIRRANTNISTISFGANNSIVKLISQVDPIDATPNSIYNIIDTIDESGVI